jgi:hypothetical protein
LVECIESRLEEGEGGGGGEGGWKSGEVEQGEGYWIKRRQSLKRVERGREEGEEGESKSSKNARKLWAGDSR